MFFCTNPDTRPVPPPMLTRALYDRVRLLTFPHIPDEAVDIRMPQKLQELRARQALAAHGNSPRDAQLGRTSGRTAPRLRSTGPRCGRPAWERWACG